MGASLMTVSAMRSAHRGHALRGKPQSATMWNAMTRCEYRRRPHLQARSVNFRTYGHVPDRRGSRPSGACPALGRMRAGREGDGSRLAPGLSGFAHRPPSLGVHWNGTLASSAELDAARTAGMGLSAAPTGCCRPPTRGTSSAKLGQHNWRAPDNIRGNARLG